MTEKTEPTNLDEVEAEMPERFDLRSVLPTDERYEAIRAAFPEVFREDKIDSDALRQSLGQWIDPGPERFGLTWPGKAECLRIIQEPSIGTLVPMPEESVGWETTQNVIIEGENLEVLKLLQKAYYGKVKLIYIDPPYNTGKEFIYPDNFREGLADYLRYSGQVDEEGFKTSANTETNGRYHSKWLSMMYPRLFLARNLLRADGAIFVSIDDHEVHNLRSIMSEVFGEENFVAQIIWQKRTTPENRGIFSTMHDYLLCFAREYEVFAEHRNLLPLTPEARARYSNPDNDPRGDWLSVPTTAQPGHATKSQFYELETPDGRRIKPSSGQAWRLTQERMEEAIADNRIWFGSDGAGFPRIKRFLSESRQGLIPATIWPASEVEANEDGKRQLAALLGQPGIFDNPKPVGLITRLLQIATDGDSAHLVMDLFAGSGTTAEAVLRLNEEDRGNRRYIMVQLPEPDPQDPESDIADITRARMQAVLHDLRAEEEDQEGDRGFRSYRLVPSNFAVWDGEPSNDLRAQLEIAVDNLVASKQQRHAVDELLLKAGFELTTPVEEIGVSGGRAYSIAGGQLIIYLDPDLTLDVVEAIVELDPSLIIVADSAFRTDDELKVNAMQTVRSRNLGSGSDITLKVV